MSEPTQQYLADLKAGKSVNFRILPSKFLRWALMGLAFTGMIVLMLVAGALSKTPTPLMVQLTLLPTLLLGLYATLYNFKRYKTQPTIIAVSKSGFDYLGASIPWSDVAAAYSMSGAMQMFSIVLQGGRKTKVRVFGVNARSKIISIMAGEFESPQAFIACIKSTAGDKYKGLVEPTEARRLNQL